MPSMTINVKDYGVDVALMVGYRTGQLLHERTSVSKTVEE